MTVNDKDFPAVEAADSQMEGAGRNLLGMAA
jgi:hypothetical protein